MLNDNRLVLHKLNGHVRSAVGGRAQGEQQHELVVDNVKVHEERAVCNAGAEQFLGHPRAPAPAMVVRQLVEPEPPLDGSDLVLEDAVVFVKGRGERPVPIRGCAVIALSPGGVGVIAVVAAAPAPALASARGSVPGVAFGCVAGKLRLGDATGRCCFAQPLLVSVEAQVDGAVAAGPRPRGLV